MLLKTINQTLKLVVLSFETITKSNSIQNLAYIVRIFVCVCVCFQNAPHANEMPE